MSEQIKTWLRRGTIVLVAGSLLVALPVTAAAQSHAIEITPTIGYRWGGTIKADDNSLLDFDAEVDDGVSYGFMVDFPVTRHFQIELLADRQQTSLGRGGLFEPREFGFDLDITYYQIGGLFQWTPGRTRPYLVFGVGVADIDPDVPGVGGDTRASASIGGGIKVLLNEHVAFRLELRGFWADTDDWDWEDRHDHWDNCDDDCWHGNDDLAQGEVKVGVSFNF